jgi:hypothetical protein
MAFLPSSVTAGWVDAQLDTLIYEAFPLPKAS